MIGRRAYLGLPTDHTHAKRVVVFTLDELLALHQMTRQQKRLVWLFWDFHP